MENKNDMPAGIKVISVLSYLGAVFLAIMGLALILGGGFLTSLFEIPAMFGGAIIAFGILMIASGVLSFFIGRGLWKGQNWARITAGVFTIIGFLFALLGIIGGNYSSLVTLIIEGLIVWYLLMNKGVKEAFM